MALQPFALLGITFSAKVADSMGFQWSVMCHLYKLVATFPDMRAPEPLSKDPSDKNSYATRIGSNSGETFLSGQGANSIGATNCEIGKLPPLGHRIDWPQSVAANICQSVEYCTQDEMKAVGMVVVSHPLVVVAENLRRVRDFYFLDPDYVSSSSHHAHDIFHVHFSQIHSRENKC
jgi:hypothetical protein